MPQIAQQDYKIIAPKEGRRLTNDAAALGELKKSVLGGLVFDCLLKDIIAKEGTLDRVLGIYNNGISVDAWDVGNSAKITIELPYSTAQYAALSAVQLEQDAFGPLVTTLPGFEYIQGQAEYDFIAEDVNSYIICTPERYKYGITKSDGKIATIIVSNELVEDDDFIVIDEETAQGLIGLPIQ